jgi:hypothetical protein
VAPGSLTSLHSKKKILFWLNLFVILSEEIILD